MPWTRKRVCLKAFEKLAEVKPNVRLWYRDEAQFEQALKSGEIPMGQYYHDVTGLAAADGHPVRSTFPKEGGILDSGNWVLSRASTKVDEAHVFIDYMSQPSVQGLMSRKVGTAPTLKRDVLDLTPEEFAAVSSDIAPIIPRYDLYTDQSGLDQSEVDRAHRGRLERWTRRWNRFCRPISMFEHRIFPKPVSTFGSDALGLTHYDPSPCKPVQAGRKVGAELCCT